jgi:hypothetical protein
VTGFLGENTTKPICPRRKRRLRRRIGLRVARPRRRRVIEGWRKEAIKANREIGRVVLAYEAERDGSLGAPRDSFDISWLRAPLIKAPRSPSDLLDHKLLAFSHWRVLSTRGADCPRRQAQLHLAGGIEAVASFAE